MKRATLLLALGLAGCIGNLSWKTVKSGTAPTKFALAPDGSTWGYGAAVMRRSAGGAWTLLDVCGKYAKSGYYAGAKQDTDVAFAGGATWVLCGNTTLEGQALLRYDGGNATQVVLPNDTDVQLVQLDADVALFGKSGLYTHDGDKFTLLPNSAPPASQVRSNDAAGHSLTDLYAGALPQTLHWNGAAWLPVTAPPDDSSGQFPTVGPPTLRAGHVYAGGFELTGETAAQVVHDNPGLTRPLRFFAVAGPDEAIFTGRPGDSFNAGTIAYFWYGKTGQSDLTFLGDAPFNSGSLYSAGGQSGYAVDDHTLLVVDSGGGSSSELVEGVR